MSDTKEKKEKNRKIEKWIKGTVVLCLVIVLLVPAVISVWLGVKMAGLETQLSELRDEVLVVFAVVSLNDDGLAIHVIDHACVLSDEDLA